MYLFYKMDVFYLLYIYIYIYVCVCVCIHLYETFLSKFISVFVLLFFIYIVCICILYTCVYNPLLYIFLFIHICMLYTICMCSSVVLTIKIILPCSRHNGLLVVVKFMTMRDIYSSQPLYSISLAVYLVYYIHNKHV